MKKLFCVFCGLVLVLLFSLTLTASVNGAEEYVTDARGFKVYYPKTNETKPIKIPEYEFQADEFRGVWVSFFAGDLSSYSNDEQMKNQLLDILYTMDEFNMNAIMFHIRTHNDAMYPTDLAPQSSYVRGMNYERFDYLEWFINECHKRGIEFHAWLNPYRISSGGANISSISSKYSNYPKNPASKLENVLINKNGEAILDPGRPEVQDYIVDVCMEIIEKYDVDAIHFDDYFYISDVDDSQTRSIYNTKNLTVDNFRRDSVDNFIYKLSSAMYNYNIENKRTVQLGISPSGIYRNGDTYVVPSSYKYDANGNLTYPSASASSGYAHYGSPLYCDTLKWVNNEWIDYITPQVYNAMDIGEASYAAVTEWWNGAVANKKVDLYIGVGLYKKGSNVDSGGMWYTVENEWSNQLRFNQKNVNVKGTCTYQYKSLQRYYNSQGVQKVLNEHFVYKTKLQTLRRYAGNFEDTKNKKVQNLKIHIKNDKLVLTWDKMDNVKNYIVYQVKSNEYVNYGSEIINELGPTDIVGIAGNNNNSNTVVCNLNYDTSKGDMFLVLPRTLANEDCKVESIKSSSSTEFDNSVPVASFSNPYVTGVIQREGKLNFRFYNAIVEIGKNVSYEVYYCNGTTWDEDSKKILGNVNNTSGLNAVSFQMDKYGSPMVIKIKATTEYGSSWSDEYKLSVKYSSVNDMIKEVFYYFDMYFEELYE